MCKKIIIVLLCLGLTNCGNSKKETHKNNLNNIQIEENCINNILKKDDSLGRIRNHSCKTISLSLTIENYTKAIEKLNFEDCPDAFHQAFKSHMVAWSKMGDFLEAHSDVRGEMHDLFDEIEKSKDSAVFKVLLENIWDTWKDVEDSKKPPNNA